MTVEVSLVERIDALSRSEFRASVNAERRSTLAIGALFLHWGQFDSNLGSMIEWMREGMKPWGWVGSRRSILAATAANLSYCVNSSKHVAAILRIWQNSMNYNYTKEFLETREFVMILPMGRYPSPTK